MIFGGVKMVMVGVLVAAIAGAGIYVMKLQRDNAILKENQIKLEASVETVSYTHLTLPTTPNV